MANTTKTTKTAAKVEAPKAEVKATPAKKTAAKKTTTKKTTTTKTTAKKNEIYVQFSGFEFSHDELLEKVKADYIAQTGKKTVTSTKLYVKPEDMKVYYVINDKFMGDVFLG